MGLYDNAWPATYEEIKRFYPVWYRDVLEMDAIWRAQGCELDGVRATVEGLINNGYILTADLQTITSLEDFLRIVPEAGQSLDKRREVVTAYFLGNEHIGAPEIKTIVQAFNPGGIDIAFERSTVHVTVYYNTSLESFNAPACRAILLKRIPAHLNLLLTLVDVGGTATAYAAVACTGCEITDGAIAVRY